MDERTDIEWLAEYASSGSDVAFTALVKRHSGLVYGCALRRTGDAHLAQEVTQTVFLLLAQKAGQLRSGTILAGWLYRATAFVSRDVLKADARRKRLQESWQQSLMNTDPENASLTSAEPWESSLERPLHDWLDQLKPADREILLLRHFQGESLASVARVLGVSEDGARKRVSRALERLRHLLAQRGITTTESLLAGALDRYAMDFSSLALGADWAGSVLQAKAAGAVVHVGGMSGGTGLTAFFKTAAGIASLAGGTCAVIITAAVAWKSTPTSHLNQPVPLPDGTVLEWAKPVFAQQQTITVSSSTWHRLLQHLPNPQPKLRNSQPPPLQIHLAATDNRLMFPAARLVPKGVEPWNLTLSVVDSEGRDYFDVEQSGMMNDDVPIRLETHVLTAFPRREKVLQFQVTTRPRDGGQQVSIGTLKVPNPAWHNFPEWDPTPLPTSQTRGELTLELLRLVGAMQVPSQRMDAHQGQRRTAAAQIRIQQNKTPSDHWFVTDTAVSDATGNRFMTGLPESFSDKDRIWVPLRGALWPGEKAWELKFHLARRTGFAPSELLQTDPIPLPTPGKSVTLDEDLESNIGTVSLVSLRDAAAEEREPWRWSKVSGKTILHLEWQPLERQGWMDLVEVKDDRGRHVAFRVADRMAGAQSIGLDPLPDSAKLTFTFATQKPVEITFRAAAEGETSLTNNPHGQDQHQRKP